MDASLRKAMGDGRRLLLVARSMSPTLLGRAEVSRRAHETARAADRFLGVRLEGWLPKRAALTKIMFGQHDTLAKAAVNKQWPVWDHQLVHLDHQPVSLSLFRGPRYMHAEALAHYLTMRASQVGAVFMINRGQVAVNEEQFATLVRLLIDIRSAHDLWVGDAETGVWDLDALSGSLG